MLPTSDSQEYQDSRFLISPHTICDSCGRNSGPIFQLTELRGPSSFHRSNEIPSGVDEQSKLRNIENAEAELKRLNAEIERNRAVLSALEKRRDELEAFRDQERSHFSTIRRLPDDLLRRVFLECQRDNGRNGYIYVCDSDAFIRTVTRVCSYWRIVARNAPELWSSVTVYYSSKVERTRYTVGPFLEMCMSLSREMPLNLTLDRSCTVELLGNRCLQSIADASRRWKNIEIDGGELIVDIMSRISPNLVFSSLERLSLSNISHPVSLNRSPMLSYLDINFVRRDPGGTISLMSAPSLRDLRLQRADHPTSLLVDFPYNRITSFKSLSNQVSNNELSTILSCMSNLTTLILEGRPKISAPVILRSLKKLTILPEWMVSNPNALDAFIAPYLETLHLETDINISSIQGFLRRSGCSPMDVKLKGTSLAIELLTELTDVRKLCLVQSVSALDNLRLLTRNPNLLLPNLRSLEMVDVRFRQLAEGDLILDALIEMVKSRISFAGMASMGSNLQSVIVNFKEVLNSDQKNTLLLFNRSAIVRESGMVMSVSHQRTSNWNSSTQDLLRNGVEVDENDTGSAETSDSEYDY